MGNAYLSSSVPTFFKVNNDLYSVVHSSTCYCLYVCVMQFCVFDGSSGIKNVLKQIWITHKSSKFSTHYCYSASVFKLPDDLNYIHAGTVHMS